MFGPPTELWGKVSQSDPTRRQGEILAWHPLIDHCADVAACFEALTFLPSVHARMEALIGHGLDARHLERLSALAMLHDLGKGNAGFQSKVFPASEQHRSAPRGHLREAAALLMHPEHGQSLVAGLQLAEMAGWFTEADEALLQMLWAAWSHHGIPLAVQPGSLVGLDFDAWKPWRWATPEATITVFAAELAVHHQDAFQAAPPINATAEFQAFFSGLLALADWIGSSERFFPYAEPGDGPRMPWARRRAAEVIEGMGLNSELRRAALAAKLSAFDGLFGFQPRPLQSAVMALPLPGSGDRS